VQFDLIPNQWKSIFSRLGVFLLAGVEVPIYHEEYVEAILE